VEGVDPVDALHHPDTPSKETVMKRIRAGLVGLAAVLAAALLIAACGDNDQDASSAAEDAAAALVEPARTDLGEILADADGRTLYAFLQDTENTSNCEGECAQLWPPLTVDGPLDGASGPDESQFGTTARPDGTLQLTLDGRPLYRYAGDKAAGDTNGQGFKDIWFVLKPDGQLVDAPRGA
jgi:predicted lipoprotein with Yx(FWY)xxD motif